MPDLPIDAREEAETARLVRLSGGRPPIAAFREARVRTAVHAHWQQQTRRHQLRRRMVTVAAAIGAAAALVLVAGALRRDRGSSTPGAPVAQVERVTSDGVTRGGAVVKGLALNEPIRAGEWIDTGPRLRVALRFLDGTSVRLDRDSRIRVLSARTIELSSGAVYVDTASESDRFEVRTPVALARDLGTQFEVRLLDRTLRLRVRTGIVQLTSRARSVAGRAGTEIAFSDRGAVSRPIPIHGPEWDWTASVSPSLDIEGLTLATFLERVTREHGWELSYDDAALARDASEIVLHGSVRDLSISDAVQVAVDTSGYRYRLEGGRLLVLRNTDVR